MKKQEIYQALHKYKEKGYSCLKASEILKIDYKTASKYWKMSPDEFAVATHSAQSRRKKADVYRNDIIAFLKDNPSVTVKQVASHICRKYQLSSIDISERAFQMYIKQLRLEIKDSLPAEINPYKEPCPKKSIKKRLQKAKTQSSKQINQDNGNPSKAKQIDLG